MRCMSLEIFLSTQSLYQVRKIIVILFFKIVYILLFFPFSFLSIGGGAVEMAVSRLLTEKAAGLAGVEQWPYKAIAQALEIIPRTLAQNCGANTIRTLTALRAKHATEGTTWGIDGETGKLVDMKERGIWEPLSVKLQTYKTAIETAILLLRIDDIVSGSKKKKNENDTAQPSQVTEESMKE